MHVLAPDREVALITDEGSRVGGDDVIDDVIERSEASELLLPLAAGYFLCTVEISGIQEREYGSFLGKGRRLVEQAPGADASHHTEGAHTAGIGDRGGHGERPATGAPDDGVLVEAEMIREGGRIPSHRQQTRRPAGG